MPACCMLALLSATLMLAGDDPPTTVVDSPNETRYSVSLIEEGSYAAGLRLPGTATGNVVLLQPSFSYKHDQRWIFSTSLIGAVTSGESTNARWRVKETFFGVSAGDFDFTAGKRLLRWGTGYAFTATGILDPPRNATDPADRLGLNEGREMVKADWVRGADNVTVVWASAGLVETPRDGDKGYDGAPVQSTGGRVRHLGDCGARERRLELRGCELHAGFRRGDRSTRRVCVAERHGGIGQEASTPPPAA